MYIEEILEKMNYLSVEEVQHPKLQIEDLVSLSPTLTLDNILTYILFLQLRKDLTEAEREAIEYIIKQLRERETKLYLEAFDKSRSKDLVYSS